ncbi:MAG: C25 family cysteine peptidase [Pyrinomonadaceae bacterium]
MKKTVAVAILFALGISALPAFAQNRIEHPGTARFSKRNQFDTHRALTDGQGVLIRWQMKQENGVVGYNVFRSRPDGVQRINEQMILGSLARFRDAAAFGEIYDFFDLSGEAGDSYYVEGVTTSGERFGTKEFNAIRVRDLESEVGTSSAAFREARLSTNSQIEHRTSTITGELQDLVSLHEQVPDPVNQLWVAAQPGAKIAVKQDGFYRVSAAQLQTANFPIHGDSSKWRLFTNGVEQAIIVGPGSQYIEFYGKGIDTPESDKRIYYLIEDTVTGKRIGSKVLRQIPGSASSARYQVTAIKKERNNYSPRYRNGDDENYLGRPFDVLGTQINFNLSGVDHSTPNAKIKISLYGFREGHHQVLAKVNGNPLPLLTQFGFVFYSETFTIPTEYLVEGANSLELTAPLANDMNLFDNVEVRYDRKFQADGNKISFFTPGARKVDISGFSTSNVRVFDTTFEGNPVLISNVAFESQGSEYTAKIPSGRTMVGYAVEDSALLQVSAITENLPSTLASATNAADMVIISHSDPGFINAAENWANYRRSSNGGGFSVKVADIVDIYDEFGYGQPKAEVVRAFLNHASSEWATRPRYVLLVGDASYDPRNYDGFGKYDYVPSRNVTLIFEESASDDALVDFDGDGFAELAIGRVPARRSDQIAAALNKTIAYESSQQTASRGVLFAYDTASDVDFAGMSSQLGQQLLPGTPRLFSSVMDVDAHAILINRMNDGKFLVNYSGHGAAGIWANSSFFNLNSVPELSNSVNPSVYTMLTCLNGYFIAPNRDSISEHLVLAGNGGAAAAWASTTTTTPDVQIVMGTRFYNQVSHGTIERLGDLVKDAKTVIPGGTDVRMSWLLFGDPALKMP